MAAALACMDLIDRRGVHEHVWRQGERLLEGLGAIPDAPGVPARAYGEPLHPAVAARAVAPRPRPRRMFARAPRSRRRSSPARGPAPHDALAARTASCPAALAPR